MNEKTGEGFMKGIEFGEGQGFADKTGKYDSFSSTANSYLYIGQQFDAATGLYSLRARYYDPMAG